MQKGKTFIFHLCSLPIDASFKLVNIYTRTHNYLQFLLTLNYKPEIQKCYFYQASFSLMNQHHAVKVYGCLLSTDRAFWYTGVLRGVSRDFRNPLTFYFNLLYQFGTGGWKLEAKDFQRGFPLEKRFSMQRVCGCIQWLLILECYAPLAVYSFFYDASLKKIYAFGTLQSSLCYSLITNTSYETGHVILTST